MPRLINKPPRYSRHKSGQARVRFNGKTTYLGRYGSPESKEAYTRVLNGNVGEESHRAGLTEPLLSNGFTARQERRDERLPPH
jgi:hypothetical protein